MPKKKKEETNHEEEENEDDDQLEDNQVVIVEGSKIKLFKGEHLETLFVKTKHRKGIYCIFQKLASGKKHIKNL